jgi:hypothetical protein
MRIMHAFIRCLEANFVALILQFLIYVLVDNIVLPFISNLMTNSPSTLLTNMMGSAYMIFGWCRYLPIVLALGGFIYLFISPFIQEGSGDMVYR